MEEDYRGPQGQVRGPGTLPILPSLPVRFSILGPLVPPSTPNRNSSCHLRYGICLRSCLAGRSCCGLAFIPLHLGMRGSGLKQTAWLLEGKGAWKKVPSICLCLLLLLLLARRGFSLRTICLFFITAYLVSDKCTAWEMPRPLLGRLRLHSQAGLRK